MPDDLGLEGWTTYRKLILNALERIDRDTTAINDKLDRLRAEQSKDMRELSNEVTALKVKAGIAGFLAGMLGTIITGLIIFFATKR